MLVQNLYYTYIIMTKKKNNAANAQTKISNKWIN